MERGELKITTEFIGNDGERITSEETINFDTENSGIVAEIEYISPSNGGPVMRPRKPRV